MAAEMATMAADSAIEHFGMESEAYKIFEGWAT